MIYSKSRKYDIFVLNNTYRYIYIFFNGSRKSKKIININKNRNCIRHP